jgi:protein-S-isoprenylcysteine O-methyltransferase Ste14
MTATKNNVPPSSAMLLLPLVVIVIQREVIGREERYLERAFGE